LRFPGQYADPETGLHYNYFRHYDPETARYASPDPLGLEPAPNHHSYVRSPHHWTDPLGLNACEDASKIDVDNLKMTRTVERHLDDVHEIKNDKDGGRAFVQSRPFTDSTLTVREVMEGSEPYADPRGTEGAVRWDTPGKFHGREGKWELVIDTNTNTILHFNFTRE
uniref:RHS repeat-associated core domain-containing protein n=2 Tax=Streptomyces antimycoticus TaxID=68175 RepID=UPI001F213557